jgi:glutaminyl-tRNA synthetase
MNGTPPLDEESPLDFIREIVEEDLKTGKHQTIVTRFPPEPNGYLHIGHAKSICLNFGLALRYGGRCHLRLDDTNPCKEEMEYVESIERDVRWLGWDWGGHHYYASDYYERLHDYAVDLIRRGKAFVCELDEEGMRAHRGTLTEPGRPSPWRDRTIEENLDLFARMRAGEFPDGAKVLRARIEMASPNFNMRDPVIYRIRHATHHRTGAAWCIYPMYDFAHGLSDCIEGITHSICTLEFEDHRPLYDWFLAALDLPMPRPRQIEFARLELTRTVMSKRKLLDLVTSKTVAGWDDPRMPTLSGLRRRGVPPEAIRDFCERIGVAKRNSIVEFELLEHCIREELNKSARRAMAVMNPVKLIIDNYPDDRSEELDAENNPENPSAGTRRVAFCRELFVEEEDFAESPPKGWHRLTPGKEVRLKHAYIVRCERAIRDADGRLVEIHCTFDPETRGGATPDGRKIKGTLHWVSARHAARAEIRLIDHLFLEEEGEGGPKINPDSLVRIESCMLEPSLAEAKPGAHFQFLRQGYFTADEKDHTPGRPVFNRTVGLRDSWGKKTPLER